MKGFRKHGRCSGFGNEPRYVVTSPPYEGAVLDYYASRKGGRGFPNARFSRSGQRGIPVVIEVPDEQIGHGWRFRTGNGGTDACLGYPPKGGGPGPTAYPYAFVYHLAVDGTPYALRGHCTYDLRQRGARHFRERLFGTGGVNPLLTQHVRRFLDRYGELPRVTMHVLWKGSSRCYARGHLEAVEQCFVEAALEQALPLMNIMAPFSGAGGICGPAPWEEICLKELAGDPDPQVREWVTRVLGSGWTPLQREGLPRPPGELPEGERLDWDPWEFGVQMW